MTALTCRPPNTAPLHFPAAAEVGPANVQQSPPPLDAETLAYLAAQELYCEEVWINACVQAFGWESWRSYLHSFANAEFGRVMNPEPS